MAKPRYRDYDNPHYRYDPFDIIQCSCGCGATFTRHDVHGRERKWLRGHHPRPAYKRKLLSPLAKRDKRLVTCVNVEEARAFQAAADLKGIPLSEWSRQCMEAGLNGSA